MATHSSILALRIPKDRGAWQVTVHGIAESDAYMTEHLTLQPLVSPTEGGHHLVLSGLRRVTDSAEAGGVL